MISPLILSGRIAHRRAGRKPARTERQWLGPQLRPGGSGRPAHLGRWAGLSPREARAGGSGAEGLKALIDSESEAPTLQAVGVGAGLPYLLLHASQSSHTAPSLENLLEILMRAGPSPQSDPSRTSGGDGQEQEVAKSPWNS